MVIAEEELVAVVQVVVVVVVAVGVVVAGTGSSTAGIWSAGESTSCMVADVKGVEVTAAVARSPLPL